MKNRVKEFRKEKQMRQEDFAKILGVTRQTIIAIENNKYNPTLELAMKISRFFRVSVEDIFLLEDEKTDAF
ncbi:helix-turn-helix transcriptional regulator [Amedibacterium intestinale]|uniref:helix-turn-helix transcriptional regulator n=1 Tax=Amedibacterium intestinale TaxID=2583452 RepID=UPI000E4A66BE|nr:helix-turn-helix transcriptional regulator [Amedibacterium intestinale]RHO17274.1 transcriptional regulator [Eubacterium sp. AM18-26]RHO21698.1 transcriptional regulator [Eubacterium sp. AM18-10LB-B]